MARPIGLFLILGIALSGVGCGDRSQREPAREGVTLANGTLVSDSKATLRAELIQADHDFARRVGEGRLESFVEALGQNAMVLPADGPIASGEAAIRELFAPLFAQPGFDMTWSPAGADVASSGDLGYTFGQWRTSMESSSGQIEEAEGKYVTIWRRGADGRWRVQLDIGNSQPAAPAVD